MKHYLRVTLTVAVLSQGLAGCETFDPTSIFDAEIFNTKKRLPGDRQPVFPEGTPGVSQGVPQEFVKGYQPPAEPEPPVAKPAEAKPKPKPKAVAKPKEASAPTATATRPAPPPEPQPQRQGPATTGGWPGSPAQRSGQVAWPDPPAPR
jgi:hypothetical protein